MKNSLKNYYKKNERQELEDHKKKVNYNLTTGLTF